MPRLGPIRRADLVAYLRQIGFAGPTPGGKHMYMVRGRHRVRIPNPHQGNITVGLLAVTLRQADISREEWERL